jgi:hypothetical protein
LVIDLVEIAYLIQEGHAMSHSYNPPIQPIRSNGCCRFDSDFFSVTD